MKISKLIDVLQLSIKEYGDIECAAFDEEGDYVPITGIKQIEVKRYGFEDVPDWMYEEIMSSNRDKTTKEQRELVLTFK